MLMISRYSKLLFAALPSIARKLIVMFTPLVFIVAMNVDMTIFLGAIFASFSLFVFGKLFFSKFKIVNNFLCSFVEKVYSVELNNKLPIVSRFDYFLLTIGLSGILFSSQLNFLFVSIACFSSILIINELCYTFGINFEKIEDNQNTYGEIFIFVISYILSIVIISVLVKSSVAGFFNVAMSLGGAIFVRYYAPRFVSMDRDFLSIILTTSLLIFINLITK